MKCFFINVWGGHQSPKMQASTKSPWEVCSWAGGGRDTKFLRTLNSDLIQLLLRLIKQFYLIWAHKGWSDSFFSLTSFISGEKKQPEQMLPTNIPHHVRWRGLWPGTLLTTPNWQGFLESDLNLALLPNSSATLRMFAPLIARNGDNVYRAVCMEMFIKLLPLTVYTKNSGNCLR